MLGRNMGMMRQTKGGQDKQLRQEKTLQLECQGEERVESIDLSKFSVEKFELASTAFDTPKATKIVEVVETTKWQATNGQAREKIMHNNTQKQLASSIYVANPEQDMFVDSAHQILQFQPQIDKYHGNLEQEEVESPRSEGMGMKWL